MDYITELGSRALGSRLKKITESLNRDVLQIYKQHAIDFEPRWFTFFQLISEKGEMSVMDVANQLNQSHPAVNQVANALENKGLIISNKKDHDGRKRYLKLSNKGNRLLKKLKPLWLEIDNATKEFIQETNPQFLDQLLEMEQALKQKSMFERIQSQIKTTQYDQIRIQHYSAKLKDHFKSLNYEWLTKFFLIEDSDKKTLSNPEGIIKNGGNIFFAQLDDEIVGTVTIMHHQSHVCELSKMAVTESYQGKQVGKKLLETAINFAKQKQYDKMILFSSTKLEKAVRLYESRGFIHSSNNENILHNYQRCTIQMELILNK